MELLGSEKGGVAGRATAASKLPCNGIAACRAVCSVGVDRTHARSQAAEQLALQILGFFRLRFLHE